MNSSEERPLAAALDEDIINLVGNSLAPEALSEQRKSALFGKIMARTQPVYRARSVRLCHGAGR